MDQTIQNSQIEDKRFRGLRKFNLIMGFFHLAQGIAMVILSSDFSLPVTSVFVEFNAQAMKLEPVLKEVFQLTIGPVVAGFLFLSALAHFMISMPGINRWYVNNLKKGANYARWIEYSFSSSLMI
ncbi:MAG: heliorhodopsin HeR, partial [Patescibacteria group bacterium]